MEDGPGVSISRTGGWSSPTCCVITFCPSLCLRLILASEARTARECAFRELFLPWRGLQFSPNPHTHATHNFAGLLPLGPLSKTAVLEFLRAKTVCFVTSSERAPH